MRILSDDTRILDKIFDDLETQGIEVEKVEEDTYSDKDEIPMGCLETAFLILGNVAALATLHDYLERRLPQWDIRIKTKKLEMTFEAYSKMSENAKKAISKHFDILIKRRCD